MIFLYLVLLRRGYRGWLRVPHWTNTLQAILRVPVTGDAKTTENSYEYLLRFAVH